MPVNTTAIVLKSVLKAEKIPRKRVVILTSSQHNCINSILHKSDEMPLSLKVSHSTNNSLYTSNLK